MTELRTGLVPAAPGTLAVYVCESRREFATRTVLAYQWDEELEGWGGWVECVGSELGLAPVDHLARRGWEYAGLSHVDDWEALAEEMSQAGCTNFVTAMTPVEKEER